MALPEHGLSDTIYTLVHQAVESQESFEVDWSVARQLFPEAVMENRLKHRYFKKLLGDKASQRLLAWCWPIYGETQRLRGAANSPEGQG